MLFNSHAFFLLFIVVLLLHHLPLSWTVRKFILLIASYVFYAAWSPPFVLLLLGVSVLDFVLSRAIHRSENQQRRRMWLILSLSVNFGALAFFKYGNFALKNLQTLCGLINVPFPEYTIDVVLPLGISFYTFETVSYLIDVYRRKLTPTDSFLDYALFLTFFPHLVAGPIVRASDFLPQCRVEQRATARQFGWGLSLLILGLFQKVVLADGALAPVADRAFTAPSAGFLDSWIGVLAFAGQIYFDFAGYSACGIGTALCLGFVLNDNFHCPYAAVGFSEFWKRWHISLSSWLRDYLYIPLGGNRHGTFRTYVNLTITMLLGGLWHGASWQFVVWGGLHASYLILERLLQSIPGSTQLMKYSGARALAGLGTFLLVCLTWVFFRADSFDTAGRMITAMLMPDPSLAIRLQSTLNVAAVAVLIPALLFGQWYLKDTSLEAFFDRIPWPLRSALLSIAMIVLLLAPGDNRAFIYFQF